LSLWRGGKGKKGEEREERKVEETSARLGAALRVSSERVKDRKVHRESEKDGSEREEEQKKGQNYPQPPVTAIEHERKMQKGVPSLNRSTQP